MRWWDIDRVAELDTVLFGPDTWTPEFFWSQLASPVARMTIAVEVGDGLCGYVGVSVAGAQADILTIGTAPSAQGRGLGRRLLGHAADSARDAGAEVLHLDVAADNSAALGLYRSFGFDELGRRPDYYAGADAIVMRAFL
ncbi:ribosomal protein S18-alanine N-acetyltransferase [Brevibacterium jeotgali]|uniref:[Ribosomal protein bS18]-alanine N-acetyltransferase n=1 Tax=Brevibacterium jeotgali TaxID=1262550 RepID=A0A2H1L5S2_9MICO|nr:ribosomal protein S18-alanine N-acetyltransferase [Brevibacterium jeotgali]SMY12257.1 ribosomal-protein-alanine N-acetyltransferase [Brevibacterium jeotgali]